MSGGIYPVMSPCCPLCGGHRHDPILSPWKVDMHDSRTKIIDDLWIVVCATGGFVFENPSIDVAKVPEYVRKSYYANRSTLNFQNDFQKVTAVQRWRYLSPLLPWESMERVVDVGALGPWAQLLKDRFPALTSEVVEPSPEAIGFIGRTYPELRAAACSFEEFDAEAGTYDAISFFYSLYAITDPIAAIEKARRLLKPDGALIVVISHALLELEIWQEEGQRPWVDMDLSIRPILNKYYSRRTLKRLIEYGGFAIEDDFVIPYPFDHDTRYGQELVLVARPRNGQMAVDRTEHFRDEGEAAWVRRFLTDFCREASARSIRAWMADASPTEAVLLWDDERYLAFLMELFQEHGLPVVAVGSLEEAERAAAPGTPILNATRQPIDHPSVINCTRGDDSNAIYPPVTTGWEGRPVMTRAFLPVRHHPVEVFPFPRPSERSAP